MPNTNSDSEFKKIYGANLVAFVTLQTVIIANFDQEHYRITLRFFYLEGTFFPKKFNIPSHDSFSFVTHSLHEHHAHTYTPYITLQQLFLVGRWVYPI